jgi:hypothetical protein
LTSVRPEIALEQFSNGGLARSGGADNGNVLPLIDCEVKAFQNRGAVAVGEINRR